MGIITKHGAHTRTETNCMWTTRKVLYEKIYFCNSSLFFTWSGSRLVLLTCVVFSVSVVVDTRTESSHQVEKGLPSSLVGLSSLLRSWNKTFGRPQSDSGKCYSGRGSSFLPLLSCCIRWRCSAADPNWGFCRHVDGILWGSSQSYWHAFCEGSGVQRWGG